MEGSCEAHCMSVTMPDEPLTVSLIISVPNIAGSFLASRACMCDDQTWHNTKTAVVRSGDLCCQLSTIMPASGCL